MGHKSTAPLYGAIIPTPLGDMMVVTDDNAVHLLEFMDRPGLNEEIVKMGRDIVTGHNPVIESITKELALYFKGDLHHFKTPIHLYGSAFQKSVLESLLAIPYGQIRSYKQQAAALNKPSAVRAVARANGMNQIAIVIPCHRVIGADGSLTGYAGGLDRKKWLLNHEATLASTLIEGV